MLVVYVLVLVAAFYLLAVICEDFFVKSLDIISNKLKLSSDVAGATFMAVGSSAPEFFTAFFAIFRPGSEDVGSGTIVGSAIFNILVIIGASAAFKRAKLTWQPVVRDTLFYILTIILLLVSFWDGKIVMAEALTFVAGYFVYIVFVTQWKKILPYKDVSALEILNKEVKKNKLAQASKTLLNTFIPDPDRKPHLYVVTFGMSIVLLAALSYALVESAVGLGSILNINPTIIALTVLAAGTSIPDLLSSIIVAKQGRGDMAVSNAVGSNIFDILFCLGIPWVVLLAINGGSIPVATENLMSSVFLLFATVVAILFILIVRNWTIGRKSGFILIGLYILYVIYNILQI
jgi:K+-dependent Na+/Ca+ exchanger-like protein